MSLLVHPFPRRMVSPFVYIPFFDDEQRFQDHIRNVSHNALCDEIILFKADIELVQKIELHVAFKTIRFYKSGDFSRVMADDLIESCVNLKHETGCISIFVALDKDVDLVWTTNRHFWDVKISQNEPKINKPAFARAMVKNKKTIEFSIRILGNYEDVSKVLYDYTAIAAWRERQNHAQQHFHEAASALET